MTIDEFSQKVGELEQLDTLESLTEARTMLLENCTRFGPEHKERLLDESARLHTLVMEKMDAKYNVSLKDMDLGDIPSMVF